LTLDVTIKKGRKFHDPFFKLSLKPRAKDLNGSNSSPKGLATSSGGTYGSVLARTAGLSVFSTVPSGSSRLRLRFCELPEGTDSRAMSVFSVETDEGDCENWGKATELALPFRALGKDPPRS
jgi:hypothetical protein